MSDKKKGLLNENTIRRFMKLAEIDSLSDGFVSGLVQEAAEEVEEGMGMKAYARHDDDEKKDLEEDAVEEAHCGNRDDELDEMAHEAGARHEDEEAPEMDMEPAADDLEVADEPMEEGAHEEDELDEGAHEEDELEEGVDEDALVAEITRRVSARLQQESRKDSVAEDLAERIIARIKDSAQK